ncbi:putative transcriptional regulatory protein, LysR family [Bradyrhizobium sp. ORS 278]|nr:putative transcriptional regulatory protein, LysR family [Bradyrhizobium sp. ORS 278]
MWPNVSENVRNQAIQPLEGRPLIDKLELLLALAKERHFGRAAEACGVTQPTMSTSIKQLEEILGVMLVQRGSRFQGFTPEGERTLDWARRIVGDFRAMRQEINGLKDKLSGEIRLAAVPTVLGMVASLTTPFRAKHPEVRFRIMSCTSADVLGLLENLEVDAGLTYIENEPIGRVRTIPLYNESYRLLTAPDAMFGDRDQVTWQEVGQVPLCLLTPDMQNRRIIDRALKAAGNEVTPTLTSNSLLVLYTHVKTGRWASVMPAKLAETLGLADKVRSIPIIDPVINYQIGLVIPQRDPMTPLIASLVQIAREVAPSLQA